jgi:hypothetical protein
MGSDPAQHGRLIVSGPIDWRKQLCINYRRYDSSNRSFPSNVIGNRPVATGHQFRPPDQIIGLAKPL